jgi:hypothetical protein
LKGRKEIQRHQSQQSSEAVLKIML